MGSPLRTGRSASERARLVGLRVHVLRQWRAALVGQTVSWLTFQQSEACFDVDVRRVEIRRSSVGVQCITCLVVTRFVLELVSVRKSRISNHIALTKVPRSYHTSEMLGLRRIAREYASSASRY